MQNKSSLVLATSQFQICISKKAMEKSPGEREGDVQLKRERQNQEEKS
jgi:hypothetical protein